VGIETPDERTQKKLPPGFETGPKMRWTRHRPYIRSISSIQSVWSIRSNWLDSPN